MSDQTITEKVAGWGTRIAAAVLTIIYFGFVVGLLYHFAWTDNAVGNWERALVIFNGVASIGFAAAGVLLGTTVQQANVSNARRDAAEAKVGETQAKANETNVKAAGREVIDGLRRAHSDDTGGGADPALAAAIGRLRALVER